MSSGFRCESSSLDLLVSEIFEGKVRDEIENESVELLLMLASSSCSDVEIDSILSPLLMLTSSSLSCRGALTPPSVSSVCLNNA